MSGKPLSRRHWLALAPGLLFAGASASACASSPTFAVPADAPRVGARQPKLVIQELGDYECSFCADVQPNVKRVLKEYGDRILLVWRDYPLKMHPDAELAAEAAHEVRAELGPDAFWRYHDALFSGRTGLAEDDLVREAKALGADEARMRTALRDHRHRAEIESDQRAIDALDIPGFGTPTFLIKDRAYIGALSYEELRSLVEAALSST